MVEAGAHDPRVALIGEGFQLIEQFLALGRVQPGLEVRFGIEAQDGQPIVLNTGDRRLAPIALKPGDFACASAMRRPHSR